MAGAGAGAGAGVAAGAGAGVAAGAGGLLPFPFYWALWNHPQRWVDLCGRGADPCRRMAQVSHVLKALQLLSLASVASFSWPPPLYSVVLLAFGQYLNFNVPAARRVRYLLRCSIRKEDPVGDRVSLRLY